MITGNKHNIINVDALHKYHTGVNTPSTSEELTNENVTSFKVGTSNVNGVVRVGYNSTSNRPTNAESGSMWFDSTLGKPIWKNGSNWVDASGTTV